MEFKIQYLKDLIDDVVGGYGSLSEVEIDDRINLFMKLSKIDPTVDSLICCGDLSICQRYLNFDEDFELLNNKSWADLSKSDKNTILTEFDNYSSSVSHALKWYEVSLNIDVPDGVYLMAAYDKISTAKSIMELLDNWLSKGLDDLGVKLKKFKKSEDCCSQTLTHVIAGDFNKAETLYKKAVKLNPFNKFAWAGLIGLYDKEPKGVFRGVIPNKEKALRVLKKALRKNPDDSFFLLQLGVVYQERGEFQKAIDCYKEVVRVNPDDESAPSLNRAIEKLSEQIAT